MKKLLFISLLLLCANQVFAQFNYKGSLFSDVKAREIDDAVTILIVEDTKAQSGANTNLAKSDKLTGGLSGQAGAIASGGVSGSANAGTDFSANASSSRSETIQTMFSARVVDIEATGNLIIRGQRTTQINGETQTITIEGVVRPVDIQADNSVYSYNIMDMKLTIDGKGTLTETQEPGLITKFLRFLF